MLGNILFQLYRKLTLPLFVTEKIMYCSATDCETTTFGRFHAGKECRAMSHMSALPEFFVRSRSVKCKHHPSILHFPPILMKITQPGACAKARRVSESVAVIYEEKDASISLP
ncbi:hypothetical protein AVEN_135476-1 [Araneus ventricosus]|uniref:Uncharacterized protein n=1 Tax=Araneus ventricosus TaxID=182803 RepID=A0A4Y2BCU3_ARAVE|nr:hypothetical protein AVEN_135476-1 [Araneus ventricosus]